ncbi:unnamed protein product [Symbiodinium natans]|uniref:Uncharacterized protein n=1 Tax=Symbiodinium natans TaxID=878477 RepID=A0A812S151_9DINO|nr:unnamed protein product [Symbiodinium natans]
MTLASAHGGEENDFDHAFESLQLLLQVRADPDRGTGATALLAAAGNDNVDALEILLEARADPNQRDSEYQATVLSWAAHNANVDAVTALIQHRADVNAVSGWGAEWHSAQRVSGSPRAAEATLWPCAAGFCRSLKWAS